MSGISRKSVRVFALLVASLAGMSAFTSGRLQPQPCVNSVQGSCRLPFFALYSQSPESFGDIRVAIKGVLVERGGEYYLYPTSESAKYSMIEVSLHVLDERKVAQELWPLRDRHVQLIGRLEAQEGSNAWGAIVLRESPVELPEYVDQLPPAPPRPDQDQWGQSH